MYRESETFYFCFSLWLWSQNELWIERLVPVLARFVRNTSPPPSPQWGIYILHSFLLVKPFNWVDLPVAVFTFIFLTRPFSPGKTSTILPACHSLLTALGSAMMTKSPTCTFRVLLFRFSAGEKMREYISWPFLPERIHNSLAEFKPVPRV